VDRVPEKEESVMRATTRGEFARAMSRVQRDMARADVEALLGPPDDIRTRHDGLARITTYRTKAVWCYGTDGHLTTPTLGTVYLDEDDRVQFFSGGGEALPEGMFDEAELRHLLRTLDRGPAHNDGEEFDPLQLIRAVNALQPLGKDRALAAIGEYQRVAMPYPRSGREGMFLVLRMLFDVPPDAGGWPPMLVGAPSGPQPGSPDDAPRYPLLVCDDIPLLATSGYSLFGCAQDPRDHLDFFRDHGRLRDRSLTPTDRPFTCLDGAEARWPWLFTDHGPDCRRLLAKQVLTLVRSVHRPGLNDMGYPDTYDGWEWNSSGYPAAITAISRLVVRWDAASDTYTFPDGSYRPDDEPVNYRAEFWEVVFSRLRVEVEITRVNHCYVGVGFRTGAAGPGSVPGIRFEVHRGRVIDRPIGERFLAGTDAGSNSWNCSTGMGVVLPLGEELRVRAIMGNESKLSPVFRPRPRHLVALAPEWLTGTVVALARQMYDRDEFSAMPLLADALQDAGCTSEEILNHCRDTSVAHVRGCWVVDRVLASGGPSPSDESSA
jgi:hypothetical protein